MAGVQVASGTFIAQNPQTVIRGQLTIGAGCVIHPTATIIADGPIVIGANNTIEELVTIINKGPDTMRIGDGNVFEVGSRIEASSLGNNNVVEPKATVGPGATLQDNCHIGASCTVYSGETLASQTIVYGADNAHRVEPSYVKPSMYDEQLAHLRRALPSFHTALTL
eukprot:m.27849 g.27849  ORF g.27849 m.27849 type:complete len:167 (+) comp9045_c0_seq1:155-655(+)